MDWDGARKKTCTVWFLDEDHFFWISTNNNNEECKITKDYADFGLLGLI